MTPPAAERERPPPWRLCSSYSHSTAAHTCASGGSTVHRAGRGARAVPVLELRVRAWDRRTRRARTAGSMRACMPVRVMQQQLMETVGPRGAPSLCTRGIQTSRGRHLPSAALSARAAASAPADDTVVANARSVGPAVAAAVAVSKAAPERALPSHP